MIWSNATVRLPLRSVRAAFVTELRSRREASIRRERAPGRHDTDRQRSWLEALFDLRGLDESSVSRCASISCPLGWHSCPTVSSFQWSDLCAPDRPRSRAHTAGQHHCSIRCRAWIVVGPPSAVVPAGSSSRARRAPSSDVQDALCRSGTHCATRIPPCAVSPSATRLHRAGHRADLQLAGSVLTSMHSRYLVVCVVQLIL